MLFVAALGLCCCAWAFDAYDERVLSSSCSAQASHCRDFFCLDYSALEAQTAAVVMCRLSCPVACGIFPDQGSNPCSLYWHTDS